MERGEPGPYYLLRDEENIRQAIIHRLAVSAHTHSTLIRCLPKKVIEGMGWREGKLREKEENLEQKMLKKLRSLF